MPLCSQTSILWRETLRGHEGTTGRRLKTESQTRKLVNNAIQFRVECCSMEHVRTVCPGQLFTRTNHLSAAAAAAFFRAFLRVDTLPIFLQLSGYGFPISGLMSQALPVNITGMSTRVPTARAWAFADDLVIHGDAERLQC